MRRVAVYLIVIIREIVEVLSDIHEYAFSILSVKLNERVEKWKNYREIFLLIRDTTVEKVEKMSTLRYAKMKYFIAQRSNDVSPLFVSA